VRPAEDERGREGGREGGGGREIAYPVNEKTEKNRVDEEYVASVMRAATFSAVDASNRLFLNQPDRD